MMLRCDADDGAAPEEAAILAEIQHCMRVLLVETARVCWPRHLLEFTAPTVNRLNGSGT